ncbi:MAG TPA: LysM peptidoglycan-binding domain-containing protein [Thermoguttaceae bacterium]|nr:LysM peptidoglycan-binding domain-containing protein [Thermoguttaceae bacterium]
MGKEAKIGLAVILILLITFGVVLARRLSGSGDDSETSASNDRSAEAPGAPGDSKKDGDKRPAPAEPMVLTAGAVSSSTPPHSLSDATGPGAGLREIAPPRVAPPNAPQSYQVMSLPEVGEAPPVTPYDSYASNSQQPGAENATAWDPVGVSGVADASQANTSRLMPPGTATADQQTHSMRVIPSDPESLRPPALPAYDAPSANGYQTGMASTGQVPTYGPSSRVLYPSEPFSIPARPVAGTGNHMALNPAYGTYDSQGPDGEYTVQPNDSYWVISERLYGTGNYFKALAEHNRNRIPLANQLAVGDVISVPGVAELERDYPGLCPKPGRLETLRNRTSNIHSVSTYMGGRTYVVQEGDTLADIARHELGKLSRWPEIHELNRGVLGDDPDYLSPGIELVLPDDNAPSSTYTARPDTGTIYRR